MVYKEPFNIKIHYLSIINIYETDLAYCLDMNGIKQS